MTSPSFLNQNVAPSSSPGRISSLYVSSVFFSHRVPSNIIRVYRTTLRVPEKSSSSGTKTSTHEGGGLVLSSSTETTPASYSASTLARALSYDCRVAGSLRMSYAFCTLWNSSSAFTLSSSGLPCCLSGCSASDFFLYASLSVEGPQNLSLTPRIS